MEKCEHDWKVADFMTTKCRALVTCVCLKCLTHKKFVTREEGCDEREIEKQENEQRRSQIYSIIELRSYREEFGGTMDYDRDFTDNWAVDYFEIVPRRRGFSSIESAKEFREVLRGENQAANQPVPHINIKILKLPDPPDGWNEV